MKKQITAIILSALLLANAAACDIIPDTPEQETESTAEGTTTSNPTIGEKDDTPDKEFENTVNNTNDPYQGMPPETVLNNILQKKYTWRDFLSIYPQSEVLIQSPMAANVAVPTFEDVIFVFAGSLGGDPAKFEMASVNAGGDVLLPDYFGKTFDEIIKYLSEILIGVKIQKLY